MRHEADDVVCQARNAGNAERAVETLRDAPRLAVRQARESPIAAGLIAFGCGPLVASPLPRSQAEQQIVASRERCRRTLTRTPPGRFAPGSPS
ncbi:hypothetical protein SAMN05216553_110397 [Lentzea fradiae]|uniref:Uncharacterized protein n=1 Tax=Lentzea fradiae TaxID=200378 RepID=A0A1G7WI07_9PSEU|nr:hypothetical protein [Lentzea fradiae]SDG71504.1 hypothetical protein SAMN05216553_110397 [Lentzea fradiae]